MIDKVFVLLREVFKKENSLKCSYFRHDFKQACTYDELTVKRIFYN